MSKLERQPLVGKYRNYSTYSNSGVDWIGEMPAVWTLKRVKHMFTIRKRIAGELGYDILSVTQRGIVVKDIESGEGQLSMDYSKYQRVKPGDFAMNHMDLLTGYVDISDYDGVTSPDYRVFTLDNTDYFAKYFLYIFQMGYQLRLFFHMGQGASHLGRWRLATDEFNEMVFPVPSCEEQRTIAAFLDYETARIDRLIAQQQRLIELLKEKRQAVISHAVTKGLNSNAPMKESGVEWLGQVPEHWGVSALGYYSMLNTGATPDRSKNQYWGGTIPWIKTGEVRYDTIYETEETITQAALSETSVRLSKPGTLLMAMYGQGITRGRVAILGVSATYNQACVAITPNSKVTNDFLKFFFMAGYDALRDGGNETSQMNLNADIVSKFKVLVPSYEEQIDIVSFLRIKLAHYEQLINKSEHAIALLQERRTALISAAVTGKIDLRGWTQPAEEVAA